MQWKALPVVPLSRLNLVLNKPPIMGEQAASTTCPPCWETDLPLWWRWCTWCGHLYFIWPHLHAAFLLRSELFDGTDNRSCHYPEIKFLLSLCDMTFFPSCFNYPFLIIYYIPCRVTFTLERARVKLLFFKQEKTCSNGSLFPAATTVAYTYKEKEMQYENILFLVKRAITLGSKSTFD